jgi:hypothetical protein
MDQVGAGASGGRLIPYALSQFSLGRPSAVVRSLCRIGPVGSTPP